MNCVHLFKDKKITILGLGRLGRGVGDAAFLAECGARLVVTDKKSEVELAESVEKLKKYPNITFKLGGHDGEDFKHCDMVLKAAGVPLDSREIAAARKTGAFVAMSTALFAKYAREAGAIIVGITGTRGKTTVAHMIFHALKKSGRKAHLGGNVRGISTLAMLPSVQKGDIAVLELDSWQLQGFGDLKISPHIAIFTNLMPDHLDYYGGDMEKYFSDKANIFRYQRAGDSLFVGKPVLERVSAARPKAAPPQVPPPLPPDWKLRILGEHNRENASLAKAALEALPAGRQGSVLSEEEIKNGLESFEGVEGRLQFVREVRGVKIYNDNNATTPEATVAALEALGDRVVLIAGGSEKRLPLKNLVSEIKKRVSRVILLSHPNYQGSVRLAESLKQAGVEYEKVTTLSDAISSALENTKTKTGTILFSPAFASFGMFKNEYDRNDEFLRLVRKANAS